MDSTKIKDIALKSFIYLSIVSMTILTMCLFISNETLLFIVSVITMSGLILILLWLTIQLYKLIELTFNIKYFDHLLNKWIGLNNNIKPMPNINGLNTLILQIMIVFFFLSIPIKEMQFILYLIPQIFIQWIICFIYTQYKCNWIPFLIQYLLIGFVSIFTSNLTVSISTILQTISIIICTKYCIDRNNQEYKPNDEIK